MDIMLKGNNGEKVVIPIEDLIQKYWSDENSKPNRIEMSATVKDETILAAMTICDEKEENYLSVDLESRNEKFDTEALWCSLEAPNTLNPFVTGYLLLAGYNVMREQLESTDSDWDKYVLFVAQDIDPLVCKMCYIQMCCIGVPGVVVVGNSLYPDAERSPTDFWFTHKYFALDEKALENTYQQKKE